MITINSFIDSCDICVIQEHWLSNAQLHQIGEIVLVVWLIPQY